MIDFWVDKDYKHIMYRAEETHDCIGGILIAGAFGTLWGTWWGILGAVVGAIVFIVLIGGLKQNIMMKSIDPIAICVGAVIALVLSYYQDNFHLFLSIFFASSAIIIIVCEIYRLFVYYNDKDIFVQIIDSRKYFFVGSLILALVYKISIVLHPFGISLLP